MKKIITNLTMITTHAAITTDAIELALEYNIDIIFLKSSGQPMGRVWHPKLGSISTIRRKQLFLQDSPFGLRLVKEWIIEKMDNQIRLLKNWKLTAETKKNVR